MQITELKKLERDLESLERARGMAEEVRAGLQDGKRETAAWLRMTLTGLIGAIDQRIGAKKKDIAWEAAEERIRKGAGKHDKGRMAEYGGKDDEAADVHPSAADGGRVQADGKRKHQRADAKAGIREQLELLEPDCGLFEDGDARGGRRRKGDECQEKLLRQRYRERHVDALRDWQRRIMEADRAGRHERLGI